MSRKSPPPLRVLCSLFAFILSATALIAQERFTDWHAELILATDRSAEVTETITVVSEGRSVKRGITRTLPEPVTVLAVQRDGTDETYHLDRSAGFVTIYAGRQSVLLASGNYTYTLRYRIPGAVQRRDTVDELSYNVIGEAVTLPIERLTTTVVPPAGARPIYTGCYTGAPGGGEQDCRIVTDTGGTDLQYTAEGTYGRGRGFTVAAAFAPGVFLAPAAPPLTTYAQATSAPPPPPAECPRILTLAILLLGGGTAYYYAYRSWRTFGIDPPTPEVPPLYAPPRDYSPAALSYLGGRSTGTAQLTASVLSLATLGYLAIEEEQLSDSWDYRSGYLLRKRSDAPPTELLPQEQGELLTGLFRKDDVFRFKKEYDADFAALADAHGESLHAQYASLVKQGNNLHRIWPLVGILLLTLGVGVAVGSQDETGWSVGFLIVYGVAALIGLIVYAVAIAQPSPDKVRLYAEIAAFETYLGLPESERSALPGAPQMNVDHYEELLPYAITLGIHTKWTGYFEELLTREQYRPHYAASNRSFKAVDFTSNITTTIARGTVQPASSSNSSGSSFSSGGGSAGGGSSGGGGAGGW